MDEAGICYSGLALSSSKEYFVYTCCIRRLYCIVCTHSHCTCLIHDMKVRQAHRVYTIQRIQTQGYTHSPIHFLNLDVKRNIFNQTALLKLHF